MTTEERFDKIENAIRDLIVVSRTLLESQKETTVQIQKVDDKFDRKIGELIEMDRKLGIRMDALAERLDALAERSGETEEKLHALIEIVDQIIRKRKNGQS